MAVRRQYWTEKQAQLEGIDQLYSTLDRLAQASGNANLERRFLRIAARAKVAVVNKIHAMFKQHTGNLARSITAKNFKEKRYVKTLLGRTILRPAAFVAINFRYGPHAHLLEFGHRVVRGGKVVGQAPAYPFFRPTIESMRNEIKARIAQEVKAEIDKAAGSKIR